MREELTVEARGRASWSGEEYLLEVGRWTIEAASRNGDQRAEVTSHIAMWWREADGEVPLALRPINKVMNTPEERDAFVAQLAPGADLRPLDTPEVCIRPHALAEIVGEILIQVWFVSIYVQLLFQPDGAEPIPEHRMPLTCESPPRLRQPGLAPVEYGHPGYADGLVALIGQHVVDVDEFLDEGLTVEFENGAKLSIPLGAEEDWCEAATFRTPHWVRVWMPGEAPYRPEDLVNRL